MIESMGDFKLKGLLRYSLFVPKLYNYCKSLGFEANKILPSRAFCSDENQGYPVILLAKHFGTFPFNHGRVGGIVATDRHGPHAEHGKDIVIIQASHVGYDPVTETFGEYRRLQTEHHENTPTCGKVHGVTDWYRDEYKYACENIIIEEIGGELVVSIDNQLLRVGRDKGLFLKMEALIKKADNGEYHPVFSRSISKSYPIADSLREKLGDVVKGKEEIGNRLDASMFYYKQNIPVDPEGQGHLEMNLLPYMQHIVTSVSPLLTAAQVNTQVEFDRTFRTIVKEHSYQGKKLLFIAGLHIDISPQGGQLFPLTKFVPWAAYVQDRDGTHYTLEQDELIELLGQQSEDNPDQIDLERAIHIMEEANEVVIDVSKWQSPT